MHNHYDILGVPRSATIDEIKAAYRKLCMQTHPDVAGGTRIQNHGNVDKFKRISEAYSTLGNPKERKRYDYEISETGIGELRKKAAATARAGRGGGGSFGAALPRNLLIGGVVGFAGVTLMRMVWPSKDEDDGMARVSKTGHKKLVEAWKNPDTGRWETPKPWDPAYQNLQPKLQLVPRDEVHDGTG